MVINLVSMFAKVPLKVSKQQLQNSILIIYLYKISELFSLCRLEHKVIVFFLGYESCTLVGHDWGGYAAQHVAGFYPSKVDRLILLNIPHPAVFAKALKTSFKQMLMSW